MRFFLRAFVDFLGKAVIQILLFMELLDDLSSDYGLSDTMKDQVRALLWKQLAVQHNTEKCLVSDI
jgi:hypothetical protein